MSKMNPNAEKQIIEKGREINILQERVQFQDKRMTEIMEVLNLLDIEKLIKERTQNVMQSPR